MGSREATCFRWQVLWKTLRSNPELLWEKLKGDAFSHAIEEAEAEIAAIEKRIQQYKEVLGDE